MSVRKFEVVDHGKDNKTSLFICLFIYVYINTFIHFSFLWKDFSISGCLETHSVHKTDFELTDVWLSLRQECCN